MAMDSQVVGFTSKDFITARARRCWTLLINIIFVFAMIIVIAVIVWGHPEFVMIVVIMVKLKMMMAIPDSRSRQGCPSSATLDLRTTYEKSEKIAQN